MAAAFPLPVPAAQVGTYFVGQYYQMLQNQPDFVHQFYSESSTMLRIDGHRRETASSMLQIHQLAVSLNYMGIEIKTAHSLESWNGGVLVMVSGCVLLKGFAGRRKFMETFFLAPQEKGYFVLNDIFHYVEEEQIMQHPIGYLSQSNLDPKYHSLSAAREQVPNYMSGGDIQSRGLSAPAKIEAGTPANNHSQAEQLSQKIPETENAREDDFEVHSNGVLPETKTSTRDHFSGPIEESVLEPQKHTYASIVAKGQSTPPVSQASLNKQVPPEHTPETIGQPSLASSNQIERSGMETVDEASAMEDEVEVKSVYVRNVPMTMSASEIGEEFKKFGRLKPDAVAIRTRKDMDGCYAFVEFEDVSGVQNAIKASAVQIGEHQLYIEGRRPNRNSLFRGGRARGRDRISSYQMGGGRSSSGGGRGGFNRGDGFEHDYGRQRGNGFYRKVPRQEWANSHAGYHPGSRNGHNLSSSE
ncbi:nuclear transport factor 2-like isoform X2 [Andrographis paniculata]|uniref:nuclear transport factor 2-like isoform X2 n=1 Tax=Andrographis paniculata TaxID=175694 RepID=UPI0021E7A51E|nr:nuclear transport factor 2-like isoform X2 [Andrographis paniculata]